MRTVTRPDDPSTFVDGARPLIEAGEPLQVEVGGTRCLIDGALALALLAVLGGTAEGGRVVVTAVPDELTTGQVADLLGVSRPTVVSLIDSGRLSASRIGSHRRVRADDALRYRAEASTRRATALDELALVSDELGLYDED